MEHTNTPTQITIAAPTVKEVNGKMLELTKYSTPHLKTLAAEQAEKLAFAQAELEKAIRYLRTEQIRAAALAKLVR